MAEYVVNLDCLEPIREGDVNTVLVVHDKIERIVRCRDCKWYMHGESMWDTEDWCIRFDDAPIEPDGFCKWGKLREE